MGTDNAASRQCYNQGKVKNMRFMRTCQECGHRQEAKEPKKDPSDSYRQTLCRECKSPALDYGSEMPEEKATQRAFKP